MAGGRQGTGLMPRYAEKTQVTPEKSRIEIERILQRYGADQFVYGWDGDRAVLGFRYQGIMVRFKIPLPDRKDFESSPTGRSRTENAVQQAYDQAVRQSAGGPSPFASKPNWRPWIPGSRPSRTNSLPTPSFRTEPPSENGSPRKWSKRMKWQRCQTFCLCLRRSDI